MREALETPGRTAALVTPDRNLARRVAAELQRWDVEVDDSAGLPLADTPPGAFLRLIAQAVGERAAPAPLLAMLKHPLAAGGMRARRFSAQVRELERRVLRGPRPAAGFEGLARRARAAAGMPTTCTLSSRGSPPGGVARGADGQRRRGARGPDRRACAIRRMARTTGDAGHTALWAARPAKRRRISSTSCGSRRRAGAHPGARMAGAARRAAGRARSSGRATAAIRACSSGDRSRRACSTPTSDPRRPQRGHVAAGAAGQTRGCRARCARRSACPAGAAHRPRGARFRAGRGGAAVVLTRAGKVDGAPDRALALAAAARRAAGRRPALEARRWSTTMASWPRRSTRPARVAPVKPPQPRPPVDARPREPVGHADRDVDARSLRDLRPAHPRPRSRSSRSTPTPARSIAA